jgi:hypothetical protein
MNSVPGRAAPGDPALLDVKAVEGDGATYAPGSRATRGIVVLVRDETGRPVDGVIVSFTLPTTGPGGEFSSGGRTAIARTGADGRASVWGMRWNRVTGPFEIRVIAVKGQARASLALTQNLAGDVQSKQSAPSTFGRGGLGSHKWLWIALAGAAAAGAAGFAAKGSSGNSGSADSTSSSAVQIGTPSLSLGHP